MINTIIRVNQNRMSRSNVISVLSVICLTVLLLNSHAAAQDAHSVIISEIQIDGGTGHTEDEFIELKNISNETIDISGWKIKKQTSSGSIDSIVSIPTDDCIFLPPDTHFLWANTKGKFAPDADITTGSSSLLAKSNTFELLNDKDVVMDSLTWGADLYSNQSMERDPLTLTWTLTSDASPQGHEHICQQTPEPTPDDTTTSTTAITVRLNEILPNPTDGDEFIELFNFGETDIDLLNWSLRDASNTGKYIFKESAILPAHHYFTLLGETFSFALNNTNETLSLFDPQGKTIDTVSYEKTKKDISYNQSSSGWRWSDLLTPGAENQFTKQDKVKTSTPKTVFRDVPATFSVKDPDDDTSYRWDFGDGHTSRLASVKHTYDKSGHYQITLTVSGSVEDVVKTFDVTVKKLPKPDISIVAIDPDPSGADTDNESITLRSGNKKKIDLLGWSIATGTKKESLTNHPIRESFVIKPGKDLSIGNNIAAFSLPNKSGFVELRRPDKKTVDAIRYAKPSGIDEGAMYQKISTGTWSWTQDLNPDTDTIDTSSEEDQATDATLQSIATADSIINALDNLSPEELSLLKSLIEKKMEMTSWTEIPDNSFAPETPANETIVEEDAAPETTPVPEDLYHQQSIDPSRPAIPTSPIEKILSSERF